MAGAESTNASTEWSPSVVKAAMSALLGGLIGFALIQMLDPVFDYAELPEMGLNPTGRQIKQFIAAQKEFYSQNYAAEFAILGACIGVCFVGLTLQSKRLPSALLAGHLGAGGAAVAAYYGGLVTGEELALSKDQSLVNTALVSFGIWATMAVGIALGATVLRRNLSVSVQAVLGGLIAAILVVLALLMVFSIVFPGANLTDHIPITATQRAIWAIVASLTFGASMAIILQPSKQIAEKAASPADDESHSSVPEA